MENENQNEIVESQNTEIAPEQRYYNGPVTLEEAESYITSGLVSTARNYVAIGYWLRRIRDGKLYEEEGHQNFEQYVHEKYGKDKGWASKCIKVNQQLSKDGDSPLLDSRYRDYSTYQLVELAYMTEEQREQATPEQTVKQLQEIRKPKEIPYYDIDGQQEMEKDYPEVIPVVMSQLFPGEEIPEQEEQEPPVVEQAEVSQYFEIEKEEETSAADEPENAAEKQQDIPEKPKTEKCIHDGISRCTLSEEDKEKDGTGKDCAHHCCWNCVKRDGCNIECYASSKRKTLDDDEVAAEDEENAEQPAEPIEFDRKTLEDMIRNAQGALDQMCDYWVENQPYTYARYNMMIQAYKLLLKEHDESDQKLDPVEQQPELRLLKNDKQRAEFIDAYEEWPLWIDNQETGEKYYRYELPDGTSFVVKTYHSMLYDYKAGTGMRYKEGYGRNEQYILEPGKFFRDCSANRSAMIEKLKELQKSEQGGKKDADRIKTENRR